MELLSIKLNGTEPDYQLKDDGLSLIEPPENFVLEITNRIHPESNSDLNGLYQSSGNFCTQCEAHGFRKITYYLDRPDVLSVFTTHIYADRDNYSVLLSNGNITEQSSSHASWHDPAPKPCYLFALVAGKLQSLNDSYTTSSGRDVDLRLYVEPHNMHKTAFAMESLKRAFKWEEDRFGLCYDLDIYMIVAVDDFNSGAMENKGLNIFNSDCILANKDTTIDSDFLNIESIIAHEYFHNWTGNRVTCRDWFQLSLKEGLTVFRDQEFSSDMRSRSIKRIEDVVSLKTRQFSEDSGPMAHPVRPESYIVMDNFYTATVYDKGAEVIRMIHTILGEEGFQKGMQLYFQRHDGDAVTIDDFVASMADANKFDFETFMPWYCRAGTPEVEVVDDYDAKKNIYRATFRQKNQSKPYVVPNNFGLLDTEGCEVASGTILLDELEKTIEFKNIETRPIPSWFRAFSAPIIVNSNISNKDKIYLSLHDTDPFNRWDNIQSLWLQCVLEPEEFDQNNLFDVIESLLKEEADYALLSKMLQIPAERILHQNAAKIDVAKLHQKRENVIDAVSKRLKGTLISTYEKLSANKPFDLSTESIGERALKSLCLKYIANSDSHELAYEQFNSANCMTDRMASFKVLIRSHNPYLDEAIERIYNEFKDDAQVIDMWFSYQSLSPLTTSSRVKELMGHSLFSIKNPNRVRSLVGAFTQNHLQFHCQDGYRLFGDFILELDSINPQVAARLVGIFNLWKKYTPNYSEMQRKELEAIRATRNLSNNVFEIVNIALEGE
jgi:aminopeptidase N